MARSRTDPTVRTAGIRGVSERRSAGDAIQAREPVSDGVRHARGPRPDALRLTVLELLNESQHADITMNQATEIISVALGGQIGEIWMPGEGDGHPTARCVWRRQSTALPDIDSGRPSATRVATLIEGVLTTGKPARAAVVQPAALQCASRPGTSDLDTLMVLPLQSAGGSVGALAIYGSGLDLPTGVAADELGAVCRHVARFIERATAEASFQAAARSLSDLASTDPLTGLKNRRDFDRALRTIPREPFAVLSIDVDGLKEVNDTHGHPAGDTLLRLVGRTLGVIVRGWDVIARVGGDEFAALLPGIGVFGAAVVAERMRAAMHTLHLPSGPVRITVGWCTASEGADPMSVWQRADECLYNAKRAGRDRVVGCSYERGESGDIAERPYSDVVVRVLQGGDLRTMFQPIVNLLDGTVLGYEALARPEGFAALDSVEAVFEAARVAGQIRDLDAVCRKQALEDARGLPTGVPVFLNISAAALLDALHGVDELLATIRATNRTPSTVVLEITEHEQIRDYGALTEILATYRAEGIRFAVDDVGEGHSTLELLAASSSEYLKLGRSLTITSSRIGSRAAIGAVIAFARTSGATVIAEGVENEFVADLMKGSGIEWGQGFGLGMPTLATALENAEVALIARAELGGLRPRRAPLAPPTIAREPSLPGRRASSGLVQRRSR